MAEVGELNEKKNASKGKNDKPLILPKTVADKQRVQIEKLMKNPEKPVFIPDRPKEWIPRSAPEFVRDVMGSSAGAGSGEFHVYRGYRRREFARQAYLEKKSEKEQKDEEFQEKLKENEKVAEEKTAKKRAKRQRKKKKMLAKKKKVEQDNNETGGESEDTDDDEEGQKSDDAEENCFVIGGR